MSYPKKFKLLDVVAVLKDVPNSSITLGQVGTIVEILDERTFEIEFCNKKGETIALLPVSGDDLLLLKYDEELIA